MIFANSPYLEKYLIKFRDYKAIFLDIDLKYHFINQNYLTHRDAKISLWELIGKSFLWNYQKKRDQVGTTYQTISRWRCIFSQYTTSSSKVEDSSQRRWCTNDWNRKYFASRPRTFYQCSQVFDVGSFFHILLLETMWVEIYRPRVIDRIANDSLPGNL